MLSGNFLKTIKFEIFHFVQDDDQLAINKSSENIVISTIGRNLKYLTGH